MVGIPACVVGGLAYSYTSGKSIMDGIIAAYGALYKVPGRSRNPNFQHLRLSLAAAASVQYQMQFRVPAAALRRLCAAS